MKLEKLVPTIMVLVSVAVSVLVVELFLKWDDRWPDNEFAEVELNGRKYKFLERHEQLVNLDGSVVFIGDSFTVGAECGIGHNYPSAFEQAARSRGSDLRVLNLGLRGMGPFKYLSVVSDVLATGARPRAAIVTIYNNDIQAGCAVANYVEEVEASGQFDAAVIASLRRIRERCMAERGERATYSRTQMIHRWFVERSHLYGLFREFFVRAAIGMGVNVGFGRTAHAQYWQDHDGQHYRLMKYALGRIVEELDRVGIPVMMVIYPDVSGIGPDNPFVEVYDRAARELSSSLGVPVISGYEVFFDNSETKSNMGFSLTDEHPSCKAHGIFGAGVHALYQQHLAGG